MNVPPEILDTVVDILAAPGESSGKRDVETLLVCSLTSRVLRRSVQRHLFRTLRIAWAPGTNVTAYIPKITQLYTLMLHNPEFYAFMRHLDIELDISGFVTHPDTGLIGIMQLLSVEVNPNSYIGLDSLRVSGHNDTLVQLSVLHPEFGNSLDRLINPKHEGARRLRTVVFSALAEMPPSLETALSPSIEDLTLNHVYFKPLSVHAQPTKHHSALRSLCINGSLPQALPVISRSIFANLSSLRLEIRSRRDYPALLRILNFTQANLESLDISSAWYNNFTNTLVDIQPTSPLLNLGTQKALRTLNFHFTPKTPGTKQLPESVRETTLPLITRLAPLKDTSLDVLKTITIHLTADADIQHKRVFHTFFSAYFPQWRTLDEWMSSPCLPLLHRVSVVVDLTLKGRHPNKEKLVVLKEDLKAKMVADSERAFLLTKQKKAMEWSLVVRMHDGSKGKRESDYRYYY